ncbi:hypothetical protein J1614_006851 [Plenodomus biglobosus]|nr:hypothetical protein J1614_006851 [Plenodomus biglobosus]
MEDDLLRTVLVVRKVSAICPFHLSPSITVLSTLSQQSIHTHGPHAKRAYYTQLHRLTTMPLARSALNTSQLCKRRAGFKVSMYSIAVLIQPSLCWAELIK